MLTRRFFWRGLLLATLTLTAACGGGGGGGPPPGNSEIQIAGVGPNGIFDPSLTQETGGALWMSFSEVRYSPTTNKQLYVRTRIASSTNNGAGWTDAGVANDSVTFTVPDPGGGAAWNAVFQQEVSRLEYDPGDADANRRWKLLWHRYVNAYNPNNGVSLPLYQHGWVGLKVAATPGALASAGERKLFTGTVYDSAINGASEYPLASTVAALSDCVVFTEPGLLAVNDGVYVVLRCATDPANAAAVGKIALLKCTHTALQAFASCGYLGILLTDREAPGYGNYDGFSAPDLVQVGAKRYLIVTPTIKDSYKGCLVFEVSDLAGAALVRNLGVAVVARSINTASSAEHHGACGYHPGATASGVIYGEYNFGGSPQFRLFNSNINL